MKMVACPCCGAPTEPETLCEPCCQREAEAWIEALKIPAFAKALDEQVVDRAIEQLVA